MSEPVVGIRDISEHATGEVLSEHDVELPIDVQSEDHSDCLRDSVSLCYMLSLFIFPHQ